MTVALSLVQPEPDVYASYTRISKARGTGPETTAGVRRQAEENEAFVQALGGQVGRLYVDNDLSASGKKRRPEFEELLRDLEEGRYRYLVIWHPDRLLRVRGDLDRLIEVCVRRRVHIVTVKAGNVDFQTATGRLMQTVITAVSTYEMEHLIERLKAKHDQLAAEGQPNGGGRPFGYEADRMTLRAPYQVTCCDQQITINEPKIIEDLAKRVLEGQSLYSLAKELNEGCIPTVHGKRWTHLTIRTILSAARISGRREVFGSDEDGRKRTHTQGRIVGPATWPAIISVAESDALRRKLRDPKRRANIGESSGKSPLVGLVYCYCGSRMYSNGRRGDMRCPLCRNLIASKYLVGPIHDLIRERISHGDLEAAMQAIPETGDIDERLAQVSERQAQLADLWANGQLDGVEWTAARNKLRAQKADLEERLQTIHNRMGIVYVADPSKWNELTDVQRRSIVMFFLERIVIHRAKQRGVFDPTRVEVISKR